MATPTRFLFATDAHFGFERRAGHKVPLHDTSAISVMLQFAQDFKPHVVILGGDILDCSAISHHNHGKPGNVEGLRLLTDAEECREMIVDPLEKLTKDLIYITGNHEKWLADLVVETPGLEGIISIEKLLQLDKWKVVPQGGVYNLGKLTFMHGDQLSGGEHIAKAAVITYERSVRFGHFHSLQTYTKNSPLDTKFPKTGVACPCLCRKGPSYGKGKPNRWQQGFLYGYIREGGQYSDYPVVIIDGQATIHGTTYKG